MSSQDAPDKKPDFNRRFDAMSTPFSARSRRVSNCAEVIPTSPVMGMWFHKEPSSAYANAVLDCRLLDPDRDRVPSSNLADPFIALECRKRHATAHYRARKVP